jgi:hypothetical protein
MFVHNKDIKVTFDKVIVVSENGLRVQLSSTITASCQILHITAFSNPTRFKVRHRRPCACSSTRPDSIQILSTFGVAFLEYCSECSDLL